jgi:hypothetical protein
MISCHELPDGHAICVIGPPGKIGEDFPGRPMRRESGGESIVILSPFSVDWVPRSATVKGSARGGCFRR